LRFIRVQSVFHPWRELLRWSPDGKRLAVIHRGPDADCRLEIMDADGQNRRRLNLTDTKIGWLGHGDWR
jgi:Tol biopolymer transport system component